MILFSEAVAGISGCALKDNPGKRCLPLRSCSDALRCENQLFFPDIGNFYAAICKFLPLANQAVRPVYFKEKISQNTLFYEEIKCLFVLV
jgi:hypothetical protein